MTSYSLTSTPEPNTHSLHHRLTSLLMGDFADIQFLVGDSPSVPIVAHKSLLASGSEVFRAMFYGPLAERKPVITLPDVHPEAFQCLLRYLYLDQIDLTVAVAFDVIYVCKKYQVAPLLSVAKEFVVKHVEINNCVDSLLAAFSLDEVDLARLIEEFIETVLVALFYTDHLDRLPFKIFLDIVARNAHHIAQDELVKFCVRWIKSHPIADGNQLMSVVFGNHGNRSPDSGHMTKVFHHGNKSPDSGHLTLRLFSSSSQATSGNISPSSGEGETKRKRQRLTSGDIRCLPNVNVLAKEFDPVLVSGTVYRLRSFFDEPPFDYRESERYVYHELKPLDEKGITVRLAKPCIINRIELLLWENDEFRHSYSFYVNVSTDGRNWKKVADCTDKLYGLRQLVELEPQIVKMIRIVGVNRNDMDACSPRFLLSSVKCFFATETLSSRH